MLTDIQLDRYADVLLWGLKTARSGNFRNNDIILIRYDLAATMMAERLHEKVLDMGMHPVLRVDSTSKIQHCFYKKANNKQLVFQPPGERELYNHLNGSIYLHAPESLTHLSDVDPRKISKALVSRKPLREILEKREEVGAFGWTLCMLPTPELAKRSGLTMRQYTNQIIKACYLDRSDPVQ